MEAYSSFTCIFVHQFLIVILISDERRLLANHCWPSQMVLDWYQSPNKVKLYSSWNPGKNQKWIATLDFGCNSGDGLVKFRSAKSPSKVLTVSTTSQESLYVSSEATGALNQLWRVDCESRHSHGLSNCVISSAYNQSVGHFWPTDYVIDAYGYSCSNGAQIGLYHNNDGLNQKWNFYN